MTGSSKKRETFVPDRTIHEPARLQIISYLAAANRPVPFTELKAQLGLSAGNLSVQAKKLEEAGYVSISKTFQANRPLTSILMTRRGMKALQRYLEELEAMIGHLKTTAASAVQEKKEEPG